jgi:hypothetical protein
LELGLTNHVKKWSLDFDASTKRLAIATVWVRLLGFPLILWLKEVFKEIRNTPGFFYEVDTSYKYSSHMEMAQIWWVSNS